MDKSLRNQLRNVVTQCRRFFEESVGETLQGRFGIYLDKRGNLIVEEAERMGHLSDEDKECREQLLVHLEHVQASGFKPKDAVAQLVREIAFTHLNRLCAYKMMERRGLIREAVSRGLKSQGFLFYLSDHPDDEKRWSGGEQDIAYRHFLRWLGETLSEEIGVLFSSQDPANRLYPTQRVLEQVLDLINAEPLKNIWDVDETIGWIYQYFTPKELRDQARKESAAPRNSYELAFRNQFFTPRYVVEFLTDNTLGRTWYEMRKGHTRIAEQCCYLVRRKHAVFLEPGEKEPKPFDPSSVEVDFEAHSEMWTRPNPDLRDIRDIWKYALTVDGYAYAKEHLGAECGDLANERLAKFRETRKWEGCFEELRCCLFFEQRRFHHFGEGPDGEALEEIRALYRAVCERWEFETEFIPHREKRDPREIKILDPACGSGHFLLYSFDLLETIYEEAYDGPDLGPALKNDYSTVTDLRNAIPGLILARNLHGIDIDLRATQIAALALWLRAQRTYQQLGLKQTDRPKITKSNIVCAEPMPGEKEILREFVTELQPRVLGQLVEVIFEEMKLAAEAGSLLKIEEAIREAIAEAKRQWQTRPKAEQLTLWPEEKRAKAEQLRLFDVLEITDAEFWNQAEAKVIDMLRKYTRLATNGKGFLRRLFADDVEHGFAFVDLCQKLFDVVLMNPPFGEASLRSKEYIEKTYPRTKNDVYAVFVERGLQFVKGRGLLGTITSRTGFFLSTFQRWREEIVLRESKPTIVADLGYGVLDTAMVETAAYILEARR